MNMQMHMNLGLQKRTAPARHWPTFAVATIVAASLAGCPLTVKPADPQEFSCDVDGDCAAGFFCANGVCHEDGTPIDDHDAGVEPDVTPEPTPPVDGGPDDVDAGPADGGEPVDAGSPEPPPDGGYTFGVPDAYTTAEDEPLDVAFDDGVLANDIRPDGSGLTALLDVGPSHGTLVLQLNGAFVYTPNPDYFGADQFTYLVVDDNRNEEAVEVRLTVTAVNDAPRTTEDLYQENESIGVSPPGVLANDVDPEGDAMTVELVTDVDEGTLALDAAGGFTYTPPLDFVGEVQFSYVATDGSDSSPPTVVRLVIFGEENIPVANDDAYQATEDVPLVVNAAAGVLGNDNDADPTDVLQAQLLTTLPGLSLQSDGSFTYTPPLDDNGVKSFTYRAYDGLLYSPPATVSIDVAPQPDAPVITALEAAPSLVASPGSSRLTAIATDVDGDPLTYAFSVVGNPPGVSIAVVGDNTTGLADIVFDATVAKGNYTAQVDVSDGVLPAVQQTVDVGVLNHAPVVNAGAPVQVLPGDTAQLSATADDVDNDALFWSWTIDGAPHAGVSLADANTATPTFVVDRAVYNLGPQQQTFTLRVVVDDNDGGTDEGTVLAVVLDERGPFVDVDSAYAGTGAGGHCGAMLHPCNTLDDAIVNLQARLVDEPGAFANALKVATRPTPFSLDTTLVLPGGIDVECGYNPDELNANGVWRRNGGHTVLLSTADVGIDVVQLGSEVTISRCRVQMRAGAGNDRVGIHSQDAELHLDDCQVTGAGLETAASTARAVHIEGGSPASPSSVNNSVLRGEDGSTSVPTEAYGIDVGGPVELSDNDIEGGSATTLAVGMYVTSGFDVSSSNDLIVGGDAGLRLVGAMSNQSADLTFDASIVRGRSPGTPPNHVAALVMSGQGSLAATGTSFQTGADTSNDGAAVTVRGIGFDTQVGATDGLHLDATSAVVVGDSPDGDVVGIEMTCNNAGVAHSVLGTLSTRDGANTRGIAATGCGVLTVGGSIDVGTPDVSTTGIHAVDTSVVLQDLTLNAPAAPGDVWGLHIERGGLASSAGTVAEINAGASTAGHVAAVRLSNASGFAVDLQGQTAFTAGNAPAASMRSVAFYLDGASSPDALTARDIAWQGGQAGLNSAGLYSSNALNNVDIQDGLASSSNAFEASAGMVFLGGGDNIHIGGDITLSAGASTAADSAALSTSGVVTNLTIGDGVSDVVMGASSAAGTSAALLLVTQPGNMEVKNGGVDNSGTTTPMLRGVRASVSTGNVTAGVIAQFLTDVVIEDTDIALAGASALSTGVGAYNDIDGLTLDDVTVSGGSATTNCHAVHAGGVLANAEIGNSDLACASAASSYGLRVAGATTDVLIQDSVLSSSFGTANGGARFDGTVTLLEIVGSTLSAGLTTAIGGSARGLRFSNACSDCVVRENTIRGGNATHPNGASAGLWLTANTNSTDTFVVTANVIHGGDGFSTTGVQATGHALIPDASQSQTRLIGNWIGSGSGTSFAVGLRFAAPLQPGVNYPVDVLGNNFVAEKATGATAIAFNCPGTETLSPRVARNQNFHVGTTAFSNLIFLPQCLGVAYINVASVNADGVWGGAADVDMTGESLNYSVDSLFDADGVHLLPTSPLIDAAPAVDTYIGGVQTYVDMDGEARPANFEFDIGPDEVP